MNENLKILTDEEIDTIGEVINISMGAAATAVSTMLERQVVITTPQITQDRLRHVDLSELEPAVVVKIKYIEGLTGTNVFVIRKNDMGAILNLLMGNDFTNTEDFEFDEMSMSAACEVMNQMMGSSATAMSEMLNKVINISTPEAMLVENSNETQRILSDIDKNENVVAISFKISIKDTLDTTFSCVMPLSLSREIIAAVNGSLEDTAVLPHQIATAAQQTPQTPPAPLMQAQQTQSTQQDPQQFQQQTAFWQPGMPNEPQYPPLTSKMPNANPYQQPYQQQYDPALQNMQYPQPFPQQPYGQTYARQNPYGQPNQYQEYQQNTRYVMPSFNVKQAEFPDFSAKSGVVASGFSSNLNMLMGVQLEVSVVIGRAKQKIKDVLELGQGSVIELDKQTGSPAEIVVNGQLIAYGDVVVVGDNFGIRITDIVGTKELIDSLEKTNK